MERGLRGGGSGAGAKGRARGSTPRGPGGHGGPGARGAGGSGSCGASLCPSTAHLQTTRTHLPGLPTHPLTCHSCCGWDPSFQAELLSKIAAAGVAIEAALGGVAQDIEGVVKDGEIYVVGCHQRNTTASVMTQCLVLWGG